MLGPEKGGVRLAREPLDGGLAIDQRHDDVAGLSMVLTPYEDEVSLDDVRVDHALAAHPEAEDVLAPSADPRGIQRQRALPVLLREQRGTGRDTAQDRHLADGLRSRSERERPGRAPFRAAPTQVTLPLQRAKVIEGRAGRHVEARADL